MAQGRGLLGALLQQPAHQLDALVEGGRAGRQFAPLQLDLVAQGAREGEVLVLLGGQVARRETVGAGARVDLLEEDRVAALLVVAVFAQQPPVDDGEGIQPHRVVGLLVVLALDVAAAHCGEVFLVAGAGSGQVDQFVQAAGQRLRAGQQVLAPVVGARIGHRRRQHGLDFRHRRQREHHRLERLLFARFAKGSRLRTPPSALTVSSSPGSVRSSGRSADRGMR